MRKLLLMISFCAFFASCGRSTDSESTSESDSVTTNEQIQGSDSQIITEADSSASSISGKAEKGKQLISQSDCLTCHKEQEKLVGPAYIDVAKKYEDNDENINHLADKIINGGSGVWGQVPMTPHPAISKGDAEEMVRYILSLND